MAIFLYQIGIFIAILIASSFGKNSRNTSIVLISIFTLLQVFMSWLLLLQFLTIFISYIIANQIFFSENEKSENEFENHENRIDKIIEDTRKVGKKTKRGFEVGCGYLLLIFSVLYCIAATFELISGKSELGFTMPIILIIVFFITGFIGWAMTRK